MTKDLKKRILTSIIIFPLSIFFVIQGGNFLLFFLLIVFFTANYELFSVFNKKIIILFLDLILILSLFLFSIQCIVPWYPLFNHSFNIFLLLFSNLEEVIPTKSKPESVEICLIFWVSWFISKNLLNGLFCQIIQSKLLIILFLCYYIIFY